jgi:hypothetical protein
MTTKLQMVTRSVFGRSNKARLNVPLMSAVQASGRLCETCEDITKQVDSLPDGGEFIEAASFPGKTVQRLDAHFKSHWKTEYELVDLSGKP